MNNAKRLFSLMISLCLLLSLAAPAMAQESPSVDLERYSAVVRFEEGADADALCEALEELPGINIRWRYSALFSGAAIEGTKASLALAGRQVGVASVSLSRKWVQADIVVDPMEPSNSLDVMNGLDTAYDGDGMVVAVLDSGLKLSHETFADYGIMDTPAISSEQVETFVAEGGTDGRFISVKIPFAYDYSGKDRSVHTADNHGTHVSALAVGYAEYADGRVKFRGGAPAAQLLCMKVFPDDASLGADDADILKAMEDAYLLGADVINLSLGMPNAYENDPEIGAVYSGAVTALEAAGVIVCCAAGNEGTALTGKPENTDLPSVGYTGYANATAPAIYDGTVAIAAVNSAFYEAGGGLMAGDRTILYTDAVSDVEGWEPPAIDTLAGQELTYVVIDGLGTAEDFAGIDLTGCAALVSRGEIYFTEKVNNAAAAGAVLCIIYNNAPGAILAAVEDTAIPCVVITQEDGAWLIEQAVQGRGTIAVAPERVKISSGDSVTMFSYSSWGASPSLHLVPALSAPGGMILSAGMETNGAYGYLSGTSMAAPNASGAYALVLQALRERGIEDKAARAQLATALLTGTAQLVTDEEGVPLSPRRQGAGVIDINAALNAGAVITDPLLEPGESETGNFTLRFSVRNLTQEEKVFTVTPRVLTDCFAEIGGFLRSTLSPLEITDRVAVFGPRVVRVAPMGEETVTIDLIVPLTARQQLMQVFENGFFTEGYVFLTDEQGESIHATFLGYCGDWEKAPVLETADFAAVMNAYYAQETGEENAVAALPVNMYYNFALLCDAEMDTYGALLPGENPWLVTPYFGERNAMSTVNSDAIVYTGDRILIDLYTLRNAEHVIMVVSDQRTGEIYRVDDRAYLLRSLVLENVGQAVSDARFLWDGTDSAGHILPHGTAVTVSFYAWLETETEISEAYDRYTGNGDYQWLLESEWDSYKEWTFPLVLDAVAPLVTCRVNDRTGAVTITVTDSHFTAYVSVQDAVGNELIAETYADERAGKQHTLTASREDMVGHMLYVTAVDYAGNRIGYEIDLSSADLGIVQCERCAVAMLLDVDKNAWYHDAVDYVIDRGLMTVGDDLNFSPHTGALRVQVLELLYELAGSPSLSPGTVQLPFADVTTGSGYRGALEWAYSEGIVTGYDETMFGAYAPLQRSQLAVMLWRAARLGGEVPVQDEAALNTYADGDTVPEWARQAFLWAVEEGYIRADEAGNLKPSTYVTRAEFAYLLMMIYENNNN